jgi:hypothetical protein
MRATLVVVFVSILLGCGSSAKDATPVTTTATTTVTTTSPAAADAATVAAQLCALPTAAQLAAILGAPVTAKHPSQVPGTPNASTTGAPRCIFAGGRTQLALALLTYRHAASIRPLLTLVRQGQAGPCRELHSRSRSETSFACTSTAAKAPDGTGAPEVTARLFAGHSAVNAGWTGAKGDPLPHDAAAKAAALQALASTAIQRYGAS